MPKYSPGPLTLRCSKCKVGVNYQDYDRRSGQQIVRLPGERQKWVGSKMRSTFKSQWRVKHLICGWTWWTTHPNAKGKPLAPEQPQGTI